MPNNEVWFHEWLSYDLYYDFRKEHYSRRTYCFSTNQAITNNDNNTLPNLSRIWYRANVCPNVLITHDQLRQCYMFRYLRSIWRGVAFSATAEEWIATLNILENRNLLNFRDCKKWRNCTTHNIVFCVVQIQEKEQNFVLITHKLGKVTNGWNFQTLVFYRYEIWKVWGNQMIPKILNLILRAYISSSCTTNVSRRQRKLFASVKDG